MIKKINKKREIHAIRCRVDPLYTDPIKLRSASIAAIYVLLEMLSLCPVFFFYAASLISRFAKRRKCKTSISPLFYKVDYLREKGPLRLTRIS